MKIEFGKTPVVIAFYEFVRRFLENGDEKHISGLLLFSNMHRWNKLKEKAMLSWDVTEENLRLLNRCINNSNSLDDETWTETQNEFIVAAFKDLSTFRNPEAIEVLNGLRTICNADDRSLILWGRKVTKRNDGSAVMVLHVSNLEALEKMLHEETGPGRGFLQEGLMIYR